jgi:hypothetical protein
MKKFTYIFALLITATLFAQNPKDKSVGDFNEVKVYDLIEVNLVKSDENRVVITGDDVEDVEVFNKDGKLKIRMAFDRTFDGQRTFVAVHYTDLDIIDGNEGSRITSNELIEQDKITLKTQEGAKIKVGLNVKNVNIRAVTGGIVETHGKADSQEITLNTGGIYEGRDFQTKNTKVTIRAAGEAEVNASDLVDAKMRAGGDILIYGQPDSVKEDRMFGGRIKRMN